MSAKHTQGPLVLDQHGAIRGGPMVRFINGSAQEQVAMTTVTSWMEPGEHIENARRLVACWNACEGISTDAIETEGSAVMGWARAASKLLRLRSEHDELQESHQAIKEHRDELLAALRCAIKKAPELITVSSIRSAIENAEGGK